MLVLPLERIGAGDGDLAGGKAVGLAGAIAAGERVPPGFCVTTDAHRDGTVPAAEVAAAYDALGGGPVAVRSSATAEDLPDASFAGQQDTYLDVEGIDDLVTAIRRCWDSLWTDRAVAYRRDRDIDDASVRMAVVVQRMVRPRAAGVLFTANPVTGTRGETVVDAVPGLGTGVVDGSADPDHYTVRPDGGLTAPADGCLSVSEVEDLHALGLRLQEHFGAPQDVEWAIDADGVLWTLQSRAVTTLFPRPPEHPDGPRVYFEAGHMQGLLRPCTPMGMSALKVATADWFRSVGARIDPYARTGLITDIGGRFYLDLTPFVRNRWIRGALPQSMELYGPRAREAMRSVLADPRFAPRRGRPVRVRAAARAAAAALPLAREFVTGTVAALRDPVAARERVLRAGEEARLAVARGPGADAAVRERLAYAEHVQAHALTEAMTPMLGPLYVGVLAGRLPEYLLRGIATPAEVATVLRGMPGNVTTTMDLELWRVSEAAAEHRDVFADTPPDRLSELYLSGGLPDIGLGPFLERYGHRAAAEIDLGVPRWSEDPAPLFAAIAGYLRVTDRDQAPDRRFGRAAAEAERMRDELVARTRVRHPVRARVADFLFDRSRTLGGVREYPKFVWLYAIEAGRRELLAVGAELVGQGLLEHPDDIMFADFREAWEMLEGEDLRGTIAGRREFHRREQRRRRVPPVLLSDGTDVEATLPPAAAADGPGVLTGVAASPGEATGRARVVHDPAEASIEPGDILVARTTDPGWTPLFMTAGGVVVETGSTIAHGPTVAREYGIPCVICVPGVTEKVADGALITIDGSTGVIRPAGDPEAGEP
ncbi:PEP/pyruvate-binding domain-containing protein [Nocardiopsis sp. CC223A]|uniref:PEP/pyruvate-binding domain-containing protein n=1 Tax=Nocardiopsis sp. CC223A TaxID=3044051 RepID=UPI00278C2F2C|nr:PEP/pyruvate-binding domain-containing protein [Nocardiopsis sp. CC223A]